MNLHMAARSRFSTSTVIDSEYLVPWLSAEGPLAYSPSKPPARDYFFQYTWILPGIFNPQVNLREHRYFGSPLTGPQIRSPQLRFISFQLFPSTAQPFELTVSAVAACFA